MRFICPECGQGGADDRNRRPLCHICNYEVEMIPYDEWRLKSKGKEYTKEDDKNHGNTNRNS